MFATREQKLLLQAALLQGESALKAWQNWKAHVNLEQELDMGSYRLLPLVYHNLRALGVDDPSMSKLRGIYRKEWYKTQMLFHSIAEVLRLLHAAGIETMILKGAPLTLLYYKDYGLRPMSDFDVLVPTAKRGAAIDVLTQAGWHPILVPLEKLTDAVLDFRHAWGFENAHQRQFDLHWHVLSDWCYPNADNDFWADTIPVQVADVQTRTLNPTDQLLHVCVHGVTWNPVPPVRWIADALVILNESHSEVEWSRLISQAEKRRLTFPLRHALTYLRDSFGAAIPSHVLTEISKVHVSDVERKFYNAAMSKQALLGRLPYHWHRHLFDLEVTRETNWAQKLISFPRYLQRYIVKGRWQMLTWAISTTIVTIGKAVRGRIYPEDVDDSLARADWNWKPDYDVDRFFDDYFLPEIRKRYGK